MNKHIIQVRTIKYLDLEITTLIKIDHKAYLITEILKAENKHCVSAWLVLTPMDIPYVLRMIHFL